MCVCGELKRPCSCKCGQAAKHLNFDHVTAGMLQWSHLENYPHFSYFQHIQSIKLRNRRVSPSKSK